MAMAGLLALLRISGHRVSWAVVVLPAAAAVLPVAFSFGVFLTLVDVCRLLLNGVG